MVRNFNITKKIGIARLLGNATSHIVQIPRAVLSRCSLYCNMMVILLRLMYTAHETENTITIRLLKIACAASPLLNPSSPPVHSGNAKRIRMQHVYARLRVPPQESPTDSTPPP